MPITAQYDPEADALYVRFTDAERARAVEVDEALYVDVDADGRAIGLEILYPAMGIDLPAAADRFQLHHVVPAIVAAIAQTGAPGAVPTVTAGKYLASSTITTVVAEGTVPAGETTPVSAGTRADRVVCG
jgi:uncharacterized protein YuzE